MELIILILMIYSNCARAKKKQLNVFSWGVYTFLAIFVCEFIGAALVVFLFYRDKIAATNMEQAQALSKAILEKPMHGLFIIFCGIGGFLYTRYRIDRKQDINTVE